MKLIHTIEDLQRNLAEARAKGEKIGLVPTMGALHEGHASLVRRCVAEKSHSCSFLYVFPLNSSVSVYPTPCVSTVYFIVHSSSFGFSHRSNSITQTHGFAFHP